MSSSEWLDKLAVILPRVRAKYGGVAEIDLFLERLSLSDMVCEFAEKLAKGEEYGDGIRDKVLMWVKELAS